MKARRGVRVGRMDCSILIQGSHRSMKARSAVGHMDCSTGLP